MTEPKAYVTTEEFIRLLKVGTDWGGAVEIIWRSPSKRYIIWQVKGHKAWAGIGNKWEYEPTVYRLADRIFQVRLDLR